MNSNYLSDADNLAALIAGMPEEDQEVFNRFGHLRIESGFAGRLFVLYRPSGLNTDKSHKAPEVLTTIRLGDFNCTSKHGATARVTDLATGQVQDISHVPSRLMDYPVFMSIPPFSKIRWDARIADGEMRRSLSYAVLVKARNRADFYSLGNTYCETPNDFRALFPGHPLTLNFA